MARNIGTVLVLFVLWLLMSGLFGKWLIVLFGFLSSVFAVYMLRRMDSVDGDKLSINLKPVEFIRYNVWLMGEVAKASWSVTKLIVKNEPLRQHLFYTPYTSKSDLAQVMFANSITLTPGTISVEAEPGRFLVHAVNYSDDDPDALADMDARVAAIETEDAA